MSQFKRFNSSNNGNWNSGDTYPEGTLTWDPDNGLRIHDGYQNGGRQIGITSYQSLNDLPTNLASIQSGNSTNDRQFLRYNSSTYEMEFANDFRVVPFDDIDYPTGVYGDKIGDVAFDDSGIYYCGSEPNFIGNVTITSAGGYSNQAWVVITAIPNNTPVHVGERLTDGTITQTVEEIVEGWPGYDGSRMIVRVAADVPGWHGGTPSTLSIVSSGNGISTGNWVKFSKSYNDLTDKPTLFSGSYDDLSDQPTIFDGNYNSLSNKPTYKVTVSAGSGPGGNNQTDSLVLAGLNPVTDIPTTWGGDLILQGGYGGSNSDLFGEVRIKSGQIGANYEWHFTTDRKIKLPAGGDIVDSTGASVLGGGSSFSGSYTDLTNKPTIPADVSNLTDTSGLITSRYEVKSANFTAEAGKTYWLNSGTSAKTVTLPASPTAGDWVKIYDGSLNWSTYNLTVNGNGNNIRTVDMMAGQTWGTPASTATLNQSAISPTGPLGASFIWNGTYWHGAA